MKVDKILFEKGDNLRLFRIIFEQFRKRVINDGHIANRDLKRGWEDPSAPLYAPGNGHFNINIVLQS